MKSVCAKTLSLLAPVLFVVVPLVISAAPAKAQKARPDNTAPPRKTADALRLPSVRERQAQMDEIEREAARPRTPEEERLALAQIAEDFRGIQILNNKMMSSVMKAAVPDYQSIANTTAEIRKHAGRLSSNLRLPKAEPEEKGKKVEHKPAVDAATMKTALLALDGSIMSFIENPIFLNPSVMDVEQASKAGRGLDKIIEASGFIIKDAERLNSLSKKKP